MKGNLLKSLEMFYGEPTIRRAVPLALGLLSASNPQLTILETLSRYSHDNDLDVAMNAIFAMGLVGARFKSGQASPITATISRLLCQGSRLSVCRSNCTGSRAHGQRLDISQSFPHGSILDEPYCYCWTLDHFDCLYRRS